MEYAPQDASQNASQDATDSGLSIRELEAQITELAGHLNAANHRWLVLIAEFDRRNGWSDGATQSCAHWLSWKCGLDLGAAREKVRVARAIESLPKISVAMSNGQLSYSKARALTRVATPAIEDVLLNVALNGTTHHVETLVRQFRRVQEVEELSREARQYSGRRSRISTTTTVRWWSSCSSRPRAVHCFSRRSRRHCRRFRCRMIVKIRCTFQLKRVAPTAVALLPRSRPGTRLCRRTRCVVPTRSSSWPKASCSTARLR